MNVEKGWVRKRNEYEYPNYEHDGDSLAQATYIIDPPDEPLLYTENDMQKVIRNGLNQTSDVDFQLQKAKDLLLCVCKVMPNMGEDYAVSLRSAIEQFLTGE
jgi:hypothetical protein